MNRQDPTTTALIPFTYQDHDVPVRLHDDGEPLWRAADVGKVLGYTGDMGQHSRRLDEDERTLIPNQGGQNEWWVTESGLYNLILGSRKKAAKNFKRWITHEVIPQIRKTGRYELPQRAMTSAEMFLEQAKFNVEMEHRHLALQAAVSEVRADVAALKEQRPPEGKQTVYDWIRSTRKARLEHERFESFKAQARRLEMPEPWTAPGRTFPDYFYTPATLDAAYKLAMRQLILFSTDRDGNITTRDPGSAYTSRRPRRARV